MHLEQVIGAIIEKRMIHKPQHTEVPGQFLMQALQASSVQLLESHSLPRKKHNQVIGYKLTNPWKVVQKTLNS